MPFATRRRDDQTSPLEPLPGFIVRRETDAITMAALQNRSVEEMARRFTAGHRAYVALLAGQPAAWGWVATRSAEIGELSATFTVPLAQCWRCARAGRANMTCASGSCRCDYQRPEVGCAA